MTGIFLELQKEKKEESYPLGVLSFLLAGVYGILLSLCDLNDAVYPEWTVYLVAAVVSGVLWYFRFYQRKLFFRAAVAVFLTELLYIFLLRKRLLDQLLQIADRFTGEGGGNSLAAVEVSLAAAMLIPTVMFFLEIVLKNHWIFFLLTEGMLLLFPVFGLNMGFVQVILLALFQISFWVLRISDGGENGLTASATGKRFFPGMEIGGLAAAFAVVMLLLMQPVSRYAPALYDFVYRAEGVVYRSLDVWSGHAAEPVSGGVVSRGNNYRSESAQLEVTVSQAPLQTVYLRGFEGGAYMGGEWGQSLDGELFTDMAETLNWKQWGYMISGMYQTMYFVMNSAMQNNSAEPVLMDIRHLNGIYRDIFIPYYSRQAGGYRTREGEENGYSFLYYEETDMHVSWDDVPGDFAQQRDWYRQIRDAYMDEILTAYTQVPKEILPRLTELAAQNPLKDPEEITAFILQTLQERASYTLTPGRAPFNEDIAEYFLFESGRGYCVHFATAATLLYRLYGIPARYVSGYMLSPSDFVPQEDGTWQAVVTDEAAHAWTEIFLEDYGWIPVEVTPAAGTTEAGMAHGVRPLETKDGEENTSRQRDPLASEGGGANEDGIGANEDGIRANEDGIESNGNGAEPDGNNAASDRKSAAAGQEKETVKEAFWNIWPVIGVCLLELLMLCPFLLDYIRLRRLKRMDALGCRAVYGKMLRMLHFCGELLEYDGSESDFPAAVAAKNGAVSQEEMLRVQAIVSQAAYGREMPVPEQEAFVKSVYVRLADFEYKKLKWYRKLQFVTVRLRRTVTAKSH